MIEYRATGVEHAVILMQTNTANKTILLIIINLLICFDSLLSHPQR